MGGGFLPQCPPELSSHSTSSQGVFPDFVKPLRNDVYCEELYKKRFDLRKD